MSMMNELSCLKQQGRKKPEENFFVRFLKYFLPWKGDGFSEVLRKLVFAVSVAVFCLSLGELSEYLNGNAKTEELINEMQSIKPAVQDYQTDDGNAQSVEHSDGNYQTDAPQASDGQYSAEIGESWKPLLEINEDVIGWISIDTMKGPDGEMYIDYPVVKGDDNDYYLERDIKGRYSGSGGTIFMDYASSVVPGSRTDNITIFGHNMKAGTFFGRLDEYKSGVEFLRENPVITFNTLYSKGEEKYIIVYCSIFNIYENQDNGNLFKYIGYRDFDAQHSFDTWKEEHSKRSWYSSGIDVNEDDEFITLSTCSSDIGDMRWVIVARKLRPGEDIDALAATYQERADEDIYFPQRWIRSWGNKKVYRN